MMKRLVLLVALCGLLAGCGEPGSAKEKPVEQVIPPLGRLPELPQSYTPPPSTEKKPEPAPQPAASQRSKHLMRSPDLGGRKP